MLKEYIVTTEEEELYYNTFDYHELIHCEGCRFYNSITSAARLAFNGEHKGICLHPQGCIATDTRFGELLNDILICSECQVAFPTLHMIRRSYCPNCGARMDK